MNQQQDQYQQQIQQQQENGIITKQRYLDLFAMIFIVVILIVSGILIFISTEKTYIVAEEVKSISIENQAEDLKYAQDFYNRVQILLKQKHVQEKINKDLKSYSQLFFEIYDLNGDGLVEQDEFNQFEQQQLQMNKQDFIKFIKKNPKKLLFQFLEATKKEKSLDLKKVLTFANPKELINKDEENQLNKQTNYQFFSKLTKKQEKYELFTDWLFNILDEDQNNKLDLKELGSDLQLNYKKYTSITREQWKQITKKVQQILVSQQDNNQKALRNVNKKNQEFQNDYYNIIQNKNIYNQNFNIFFEVLNKINLL
ncbi:EF hand protein (macronuclear) [Tetrahymena thermophila SB210]|uniref:EF hand protein n=1 Tax=Tetrahymena thermophila (strain SB210) TaxID=312017 RepID=Q23EF9_TETTS|nr:EF hand protein [Tetrahymena thermophila SB210]EAR94898.2 EF hand protein [Tetrahymena thermophila SB210]|eukprot:XP_001015143.2 EF hand protein [Tetrahymena thermophila SB210]